MRLFSLKRKSNTLKIAQTTGISASGERQGCGDPTRTGTQIYCKNEERSQCTSLGPKDILPERV